MQKLIQKPGSYMYQDVIMYDRCIIWYVKYY